MAEPTRGERRLARRLQEVRGCRYAEALEELRELPADADWPAYVERVRGQLGAFSLVDEDEPVEWLHLHCCPVGERVSVCWLRTDRGSNTVVSRCAGPDGGDPATQEADWVLVEPRDLLGPNDLAVRVRYCPGCGRAVPGLVRREKPTFHLSDPDEDGHCRTCKVRYCSGSDPARVFRAEPSKA